MGTSNYRIFAFLSVALLFGCKVRENPYAKDTKLFNKYLKLKNISAPINKNCIFILTSSNSCLGCKSITYNFFDTVNSENIYLLTSDYSVLKQFPRLKNKIYYDSTGVLERMGLPLPDVCAIYYKNNNIVHMKLLNPEHPYNIIRCIETWIHSSQ